MKSTNIKVDQHNKKIRKGQKEISRNLVENAMDITSDVKNEVFFKVIYFKKYKAAGFYQHTTDVLRGRVFLFGLER